MAAAMVRQHSGQRFRSGRFRGRQGSGEENIQLDFTKDPAINVKEILSYVIKQRAFSKAKKLGYLNVFVKVIDKCGDVRKLGYPLRSILLCLSVNLLHAPKEVRAGTLRVIKHLIIDNDCLQVLLDLHIDYYIARSLDLCLDNEIERVHAQKLVRRITMVTPTLMPRSMMYPLVAIGNDGTSERDRMVRASLACICEITYYNPDLVAHCGGISMLLRKILDCHQYPRINESLVSTILHLVNHPDTRHFVRFNTDLEQLIAPFTDCHFSYTGESNQSSEERDARFAASRMAIVTVMRSWPGIIRFCRPDGTGLQSLVGILYLPFTDIRQSVLEMVYELFHLTLPEWTTDFTQALVSTDASRMIEDWRLTDGFVANEGKVILPHLARVRPNLVENHLALLLSAWIGAGILDALVEVIITSEEELFIRAVILLGELLHMASQLLPPECSHHSHYLPSLMALASSFDIPNSQRHQASVSVSYLSRIHALKKRGPIPCSLYLDQLVKQSNIYKDRPMSLNIQKNKLLDLTVRKRASSSEEVCMQTLKDTQVLVTKEHKNWDWDLIEYVLKWPDDKLRKLEDQIYVRFIKRLVFVFKPTNHMFSRLESDHEQERKLVNVGCQLAEFLVKCEQEEGSKILLDFLSDIALCLSEVALQRIAPESVLSAGNVINTLSHYYFLFIGRFSQTSKGDRYVEKSGIYQHLLDIVSAAPQESYVKLITSSLYYGRDGNSRTVLSKALCSSSEAGRLYSTKLLRVLLRAKVSGFHTWGMEMLVGQLYDQKRGVAMTALSILEEACEIKENLDYLVKTKPSFLHLGEKGVLILCRYMSTLEGFKFLTEANYTMNELKKWQTSYNTRYVVIVEEMLNEALTTYEKTYEGSYTRRSSKRHQIKDVYVPTHLYGQLVQHKDSFNLLRNQTYIEDYFQCIRCPDLKNEEDMLQLKTAMWAVGHISMSSWGVSWLQEEKIVPEIIRQAEECNVYSIRGTAFFILGMLSSTREGAQLLSQYGWESRWNMRSERWPLVEDRSILLADSMEDIPSEAGFSFGGTRIDLASPVSNLDFIAEEHFQLGKPGKSGSFMIGGCEDQDTDSESGIHIPDAHSNVQTKTHSPEFRRPGARLKSQTFPFETQVPGHRKCQTLPGRSQTVRSVHGGYGFQMSKDKTKSVEHISPSRDLSSRLSRDSRSQSMKEVTSKHKSVVDTTTRQSAVISNMHSKVGQSDKDVNSNLNKSNITQDLNIPSEGLAILGSSSASKLEKIDSLASLEKLETVLTDNASKTGDVSKESPKEISSPQDVIVSEQNQEVTEPNESNTIKISVTDTDEIVAVDSATCENQTFIKLEQKDSSNSASSEIGANLNLSEQNEELSSSQEINQDNIDAKPKSLDKLSGREGSIKQIKSLKDERSSSSDSSRTSKSRTDSFNTDSVTSGIGSYDSGHHGVIEFPSLSPIASTNSLDHIEVQYRNKDNKGSKEFVHPSMALRRMSNLTRVPSTKRQSSPGGNFLPSSKFFDFSDNAVQYTTARDAIGYATLRSLMKNRTLSSDVESDYGLNTLYDNMGSMTSINRRPSIDSTDHSMKRPQSILRNISGVSLSDMDSSGVIQPPKASLYHQRPHTGEAEFMGVALPVDINMIFEVSDGDETGLESMLGKGISRQVSYMDQSTAESRSERSDSGLDNRLEVTGVSRSTSMRSRTTSTTDFTTTPLQSEHNAASCILCSTCSNNQDTFIEDDVTTDKSEGGSFKSARGITRSRAGSVNDPGVTETSSSLTSTASDSSASKKLTLDTTMGRTLVRKEIIRFVINLSSSVGVKGAEQGLLSLKQKFPKAFQNLCFYSEVSYLLGTCSFRLTARRFIQELFEEIDMSKIVETAHDIIGVNELEKNVLDESLPEDFDGFTESFS